MRPLSAASLCLTRPKSMARTSPALLPAAFQNPHHRAYGVPIPRRRRHAEQLVNFAQIADGFHMATVYSEDKLALRRDDAHEPLSVWWKCDGQRDPEASGFRQDAHESNDVRA